jgi:3-phenylpropionate/cinnamic acid dioxygenase small subunit
MLDMAAQPADAQIRNVLARISHLADDGSVEEYLDQFTEDAVWEMPANAAVGAPADRRSGLAEIAEGVRSRRSARLQGPGTASRHAIITIDVTLESAESARTVAYWLFLTDTTGSVRLASAGRYDDRLRLVGGRWRLAHRTITVG